MGRTYHIEEISLYTDNDLCKEVYINLANKYNIKLLDNIDLGEKSDVLHLQTNYITYMYYHPYSCTVKLRQYSFKLHIGYICLYTDVPDKITLWK